jgi:hypothetical protein
MPPFRPIPRRRFITDEPTLFIQSTGAAYCRPFCTQRLLLEPPSFDLKLPNSDLVSDCRLMPVCEWLQSTPISGTCRSASARSGHQRATFLASELR